MLCYGHFVAHHNGEKRDNYACKLISTRPMIETMKAMTF